MFQATRAEARAAAAAMYASRSGLGVRVPAAIQAWSAFPAAFLSRSIGGWSLSAISAIHFSLKIVNSRSILYRPLQGPVEFIFAKIELNSLAMADHDP